MMKEKYHSSLAQNYHYFFFSTEPATNKKNKKVLQLSVSLMAYTN